MIEEALKEEGLKFCPTCGFEGNDIMCPVCNEKMESLDEEVEKLAEKEQDKDITETAAEVSLEEVAQEEEKESADTTENENI